MSKIVSFSIPAATGAGTVWIPVDATYTVLGFYVTPSTAPGGTSTVTVTSGTADLGAAAIGATDAAGTVTSATMSSTLATRKTIVSPTVPLKIVVDARSNSCAIFGTIKLDEFALQRD